MFKKFSLHLKLARVNRNLSSINKEPENLYEVLGLNPKASQNDIKNSYFKHTKLYHPDIVGSSDENLRKFRKISEAYEVLGSPASRKEYDENVLGIIRDDSGSDDVIEDYRKRVLRRRDASSNSWTKQYANEMRERDFILRHTIKSSSDFTFRPIEKDKQGSHDKYVAHYLNQISIFLMGVVLVAALINSDPSKDI